MPIRTLPRRRHDPAFPSEPAHPRTAGSARHRIRGALCAAGLLLVGLLAAAPARAQPDVPEPSTLSAEERVFWLAKLWEEVEYNFAYFDQVPDLDWDRHFRSYIPLVIAAGSDFEYFRLLQRFLARLHDGHTLVVYPPEMRERRPIDFPWIELREIDRRAIVSNVDAALAGRLPIGSEIVRVDGLGVTERLEAEVFPFMSYSTEHVKWRDGIRGSVRSMWGLLAGPANSAVSVDFVTPSGAAGVVDVVRDRGTRAGGWVVQEPRLPLLEYRDLGAGLAYVALNSFNDTAVVGRLDAVLPELLQARGVVLDLRRNRGGIDAVVREVLTRLTERTLLGPAWRTREHVAAFRAWGVFADQAEWAARYRPYLERTAWRETPPDTLVPGPGPRVTAPVAVLIGAETESAAENFLVYLDGDPRFTLVGQPTVGSSGQPLFIDLPLQGRAWICTKRNTYPDGRSYIGQGVQPHVPVPITVDDVRAGRDRALDEAVSLLLGAPSAGR
jgi:carboxyl-terminal processing protease